MSKFFSNPLADFVACYKFSGITFDFQCLELRLKVVLWAILQYVKHTRDWNNKTEGPIPLVYIQYRKYVSVQKLGVYKIKVYIKCKNTKREQNTLGGGSLEAI